MCGIAGYIGTETLPLERIERCLTLMGRRGPNAAGWEQHTTPTGRQVYLLHSRLSIIDLEERSNQPFHIGNHSIIFNGELYNYQEVQRDLLRRQVQFRTRSDTEVLLAAVREFGWPVLDRCEGMWAFAVLDRVAGSLTLSRDRFGEKPLYLYRTETGMYFGSEPKLIAALLGRPLTVNHNHLYRYLVNGYKALYKSRETFFQGLEELPPGTNLQVTGTGAERLAQYWQPRSEPDERMTYADAVAGVKERLLRAVELRLRADVPIAFCMSGGVDSNSLISIARNVFHYDVHGFTIVNTDERYEEQDLVDGAVRELRIRHTALPVDTRDFLPRLREQIRYHDSPVATITYYAHWRLMEQVAQHGYRISVSGTAADELFTGYYDHHLLHLYEVRHEPEIHAAVRRGWQTYIKPIVRNPHLSNPELFIQDPRFREHIYLNNDLFASYLTRPWQEAFSEETFTESLLRNRMLNELFRETIPVILHEDDLNAMYYSIENRSPFLDRELFDFCYRIPARHLIGDGFAKKILRDAMRGIAPDCVLDSRRKVGFNAPIFSYLDVKDPEVRACLLDRSPIYDHVRRERIESLLGRSELPNSESKFLFSFITSKLFLEEFGG